MGISTESNLENDGKRFTNYIHNLAETSFSETYNTRNENIIGSFETKMNSIKRRDDIQSKFTLPNTTSMNETGCMKNSLENANRENNETRETQLQDWSNCAKKMILTISIVFMIMMVWTLL